MSAGDIDRVRAALRGARFAALDLDVRSMEAEIRRALLGVISEDIPRVVPVADDPSGASRSLAFSGAPRVLSALRQAIETPTEGPPRNRVTQLLAIVDEVEGLLDP